MRRLVGFVGRGNLGGIDRRDYRPGGSAGISFGVWLGCYEGRFRRDGGIDGGEDQFV